MERQYHARPVTVGGERGFVLLFEDGGELVEVPEASFVLFDSEEDALAFAHELEQPERDEDPNNTFGGDFAGFAENH